MLWLIYWAEPNMGLSWQPDLSVFFDSFLELRIVGRGVDLSQAGVPQQMLITVPFLRQVVEHPPAKHAT